MRQKRENVSSFGANIFILKNQIMQSTQEQEWGQAVVHSHTPRLKAATQIPVATPRRQPISSSAHSGGAPSVSSSLDRSQSSAAWETPRPDCLRLSWRPERLRSRWRKRSPIPLPFLLVADGDEDDGGGEDGWASTSESEAGGADLRRALWSSESNSIRDISRLDSSLSPPRENPRLPSRY